jgi:hypothetical protein
MERGVMLSLAGVAIALIAVLVGICGPVVRGRPWKRLRFWHRRTHAQAGAASGERGSVD